MSSPPETPGLVPADVPMLMEKDPFWVPSYTTRRNTIAIHDSQGEEVSSRHYSNPNYRINFRHPGYGAPYDILFTLCGYDSDHGGIHHGTALVACGIVAGNVWDGYFTETRDGPRLTALRDEALKGKDYYFHVPLRNGDTSPYSIIPSFHEWLFPHGNLPPAWGDIKSIDSSGIPIHEQTPKSAQNRVSNQSCRLSSFRDCVSFAHLCPVDELDWYSRNNMVRYNLQVQTNETPFIDDVRNLMPLRHDLHVDFDKRKFVFVPKTAKDISTVLVAHMLEPTHQLGSQHHNQQIHPAPDVAPEFVLARFAWAIFPMLQPFLLCGAVRRLTRLRPSGDHVVILTDTRDKCFLATLLSANPKERKSCGSAGVLTSNISLV